MDAEQQRLSRELLDLMRRAAAYAIDAQCEFIAPPHLLLALLDVPEVNAVLEEHLVRDDIAEAAANARKKLPAVQEVPEGELPEGESTPFQRYDTLAWKLPDGSRTVYLDRDGQKIFIEGARRAGEGPFFPKHLALGMALASRSDGDLVQLFGKKPQDVTQAIYSLA